jgi:hypothetical protein
MQFKYLVNGSKKFREKMAVIWYSNVWVVWKARNAFIFS